VNQDTINMNPSFVYIAGFSIVAATLLLYQCSVESTLVFRPAIRHYLLYPNLVPRVFKIPSISPLLCMLYCVYLGVHALFLAANPTSPHDSGRRAAFAALMNLVPLTVAMPLDMWSQLVRIARKDAIYAHMLVASVFLMSSMVHVILVLSRTRFDMATTEHRTGLLVCDLQIDRSG
jgi:hypothetical protein